MGVGICEPLVEGKLAKRNRIQLAKQLRSLKKPHFVDLTTFDEYAVKAFEPFISI